MTRRVAVVLLACALALWSARSSAQALVNGSAEFTVAKNANSSNSQTSHDNSFWQNYDFGYRSSIFDPRLVKYNAEGIFRINHLTSGSLAETEQHGRQGDVGYRLGTTLLSASNMPFVFQASRTTNSAAGEMGPSNPTRVGLVSPSPQQLSNYDSLNKELNMSWQVTAEQLPRIDLGYSSGSSQVSGGNYHSDQSNSSLSSSVAKDTQTTRQSFRFQRTSFQNVIGQTFAQRMNNLDYDFGASLWKHFRTNAHAGRRTTFSRSEFAATPAPDGGGAYTPPPTVGAGGADYGTVSLDYEPGAKFAVRLAGSADRQVGGVATTSSRLVTASSHFEAARGLMLNGSATTGTRGEVISNAPLNVSTRNTVGGVSYTAGPRWLVGQASASRGVGVTAAPDGRAASVASSSEGINLSSDLKLVGLGAGYDRSKSSDGILELGNYQSERVHLSGQTSFRRVSLFANGEQQRVDRGLFAALTRNRYRTMSASAAVPLWRGIVATATGGGYVNDYENPTGGGRDRSLYWSVSSRAALFPGIRTSFSIRGEGAHAEQTHYVQQSLTGFARIEWRLRTLSVSAEYRRSHGLLQYQQATGTDQYGGRQFRISVLREFGFNLQ